MKTVEMKIISDMTQSEANDFFCEAEKVIIKDGILFLTAEEGIIDFLTDMAACEGIAE